MARVKTFANGGSVLPGDLNAIQDDYELGFASYRDIMGGCGLLSGNSFTGTTVLSPGFTGTTTTMSSTQAHAAIFYLDGASYPAGSRVVKMRVRGFSSTNNVAPGGAVTFGLYPVSTPAGASTLTHVIGTVVSGSTAAITPAINQMQTAVSADFTAPAAGYYVLACVIAAAAVNNATALVARLQVRQV